MQQYMNKRFNTLLWVIGILFTASMTILTIMIKF